MFLKRWLGMCAPPPHYFDARPSNLDAPVDKIGINVCAAHPGTCIRRIIEFKMRIILRARIRVYARARIIRVATNAPKFPSSLFVCTTVRVNELEKKKKIKIKINK